MAGLQALTSIIYHERQQPGSMLCAQHALNSLMQGNYFTAPDLAGIARDIDSQERESLSAESYEDASANMDDTGFFSVQVIERALRVWGLNLVRWRSEDMRPYQETPHKQLAFVLNLQQHWFTLRRFGPALPNVDLDTGEGHWYNLNSSLDSPEWISKLYLNMVLQQMETDGYSVFAICQADPEGLLALPRVEADIVASTLDAPDQVSNTARPARAASVAVPGFEDEDMELQAALQASLSGGDYAPFNLPVPAPALREAPLPPVAPVEHVRGALGLEGMTQDPVAASMARNRAIMEQMRREQETVLRESYEEEVSQFRGSANLAAGPRERSAAEIEEDDAIRRAIAASRGDADEDMDEEYFTPTIAPRPLEGTVAGHRVYDDDDAELQAALKASLETVPVGFTIPDTPPPRPLMPIAAPNLAPQLGQTSHPEEDDDDDVASEASSVPPPDPSVDVDEMRRRRLARFGA